MTNKELKEKIAHLEAELAEVKEMAVAMKKRADGGVFKPKDGQGYWCVTHGEIVSTNWGDDHEMDHSRYVIGNCFSTEQAAVDTVRVLKLIQKARESQGGFVPDWEDVTCYKHSLFFDSEDKEIRVMSNQIIDIAPTFGYWEDESTCEQFVDENNDELRWFFTEYER